MCAAACVGLPEERTQEAGQALGEEAGIGGGGIATGVGGASAATGAGGAAVATGVGGEESCAEGGAGGAKVAKPCWGHCGYLPNSEDLHPIPDLVGGVSQCGQGHNCIFIGIEECEGLEEGAEVQGWCN